MALFCDDCAQRVRARGGCPKHPMANVSEVLPKDGFVWFGKSKELPFNRGNRPIKEPVSGT
ncbi:hypothetical protein LCGC14_0587680 [marine sediment metagenome]|uniref:Uncharacterized protein n=1 Tax=marine sediment metagenome TaxID=412755 RepID=A0A0F9REH0_9ZZZZ